ncbi:diadenosine tetraphosphate (Ap4A) hydrolase [Mycobacteroides abscessus subsp. abscessus]|nr:diadenosine tetraphosphate (Ap4A) hydrolase [Mycobacteroides abscessus subsp. abscessus]
MIPRYADKSKDGLRLPWVPGVPGDTRKVADLGNRLAATLA